jgi:pyridoxal phosphate enzyme (YggS family)
VVDSESLLKEVNKQALKNNRIIDCLLQVYIAQEETKFGLDEGELKQLIENTNGNHYPNTRIRGLMGMASFTTDESLIQKEFQFLKNLFDLNKLSIINYQLSILSMGMSSDYKIALREGSTLIRIGSLLFGERAQ